jgi:hypothetical protein
MLAQKYWEIATALPEPVKKALAAVAIFASRTLIPRTFTFRNREYPYFFHRYNLTWRNERAVEIPIARVILSGYAGKRVLEVGNVLSHYDTVSYDVVDKYERGDGVINQDIVCYEPGNEYDLIMCISTLEHIGFDEPEKDPDKPSAAMRRLESLLAPGGELVVTFLLGHNPALDEKLAHGQLGFTELYTMRRKRLLNIWSQVAAESLSDRSCTKHGNAILVLGIVRNTA